VPTATYWVITHLSLINLCYSIRKFERKKIISAFGAEGAAGQKRLFALIEEKQGFI